jgi:benzoate 4-monooxygenase
MYHSWNGTQYKSIRIAHERLGPIVRIAPNHISFIDPAAYKDIYGHGAPTRKDDFYSHISGDNPSMAQATDKSVHAAKRRSLAHVFSAKEITAMEPRVIDCVKNLLAALKVKAEGGKIGPGDAHEVMDEVFDLRPWLNMFSYDAISSMFFTNSYDFLKQGNDVCSSTDSSGKTKCVQAMDTFHSASRFNTAMAQLPLPLYKLGRKVLWFVHGNQSGSDFEGMSRAQVQSRLSNEPKKSDLFSRLPITATEKRPNPMAVKEIIAECATMLDAGNDTTQTTLANCMYHLATNPVKQERLHRELAAIVLAEDKNTRVPPTTILQQVPYLRAVLEENWRCRPPVARGLPRRTIGEGTNIAGHFFGPGVTVSAPVWELHRNASLFRQPLEFIPERWMPDEEFGQDMEEASNLKNYCIPFSLGPRACIGRNLAYMEVSIVVAALILNFKWELSEKDVEMPIMERFNCNPKELMVKAKMRS